MYKCIAKFLLPDKTRQNKKPWEDNTLLDTLIIIALFKRRVRKGRC